jgi:hypothetical protein
VIPTSFETLAFEASFQSRVLLKQIECDMAQHGEILGRMALTNAAIVLTKGDVEHSMEAVFNRPVGAHGVEDGLCLSRKRCNKEADLSGRMFLNIAYSLKHRNTR